MSRSIEFLTKKHRKKVDCYANLLALCEDPSVAGSLGGMACFAKARKLPIAKVRERLEANLGYTLPKPTRRRFPTLGHRQTVGGRFDRSGEHCKITSQVPVSADGGGCVVKVHLGGTHQVQDGKRRDSSLRKNFEMERWTPTSQIANG